MVIWKYKLHRAASQEIEMPIGATFLHCDIAEAEVCMWFRCDPCYDGDKLVCTEKRTFLLVATGQTLPHPIEYLGTIIDRGEGMESDYVWHIHEKL